MIGLAGSVINGSENVFMFQRRIIAQDFLKGSSCPKQLENVCDANALAPNTGAAPAFTLF